MTPGSEQIAAGFVEQPEPSGEKQLLAAVIRQALMDCADVYPNETVRAYKWIERLNPMFVRYCGLIGIDPEDVRDYAIEQYGDKVIDIVQRQSAANQFRRAA